MRRALKHALAAVTAAAGGLAVLRAARRAVRGPALFVFGYHRVVPDVVDGAKTSLAPLCVSTRAFAAHLEHLASCYEVLPLEEAALRATTGALRRDAAAITFDDGYRDVAEHALPLCLARGLPATVFVTTAAAGGKPLPHDRLHAIFRRARAARVRLLGSAVPDRLVWPLARADFALEKGDGISAAEATLAALPMQDIETLCDAVAARVGEPQASELPRYLSWEDLAALRRHGFDVGAHSATHAHLPLESGERLAVELAGAREEIAERLGTAPATVAYPAGRYDARVIAASRVAGYTVGVTTEDRPNRAGADPLLLGRKVLCEGHNLGLGDAWSPSLVAAQLDGLFGALGLSRPTPGDFRVEVPWT